MRKLKLTATDEVILGELQKDAYKSDADLGELVSKDRTAISRRRQELEKAGVIRGYHADIDPKKVGLGSTVYILIGLKEHGGTPKGTSHVDTFSELLATMPNVIEWSSISGSWDFLVKLVVKNGDHHEALLFRILRLPMVSRVRGMHVQGQPKTKPLPLNGGELVPQDD